MPRTARLYSICVRLGLLCASAASLHSQEAILPAWLKLGGEFRGRFEQVGSLDFDASQRESYYLNRLRLSLDASPRPWLGFHLEGQDARQTGWSREVEGSGLADHTDIRQAYVQFGASDQTWQFRLGRQELAVGDERLVAADNYWDPLGVTWDAARVSFRKSSWQVDAFGAWRVGLDWRDMNRPQTRDRLYGVFSTSPQGPGNFRLEPYFFLDDLSDYRSIAERRYGRRVFTWGAKASGQLPARTDYILEMAIQRGYFADLPHRAWAGHWEFSRQLRQDDRSPRLSAEYNFATGDGNPNDRVHTTFDDLHSSGYNKYGMAEPFVWRNTHNLAGGLEWPFAAGWKFQAGLRSFWLASRNDGLYTVGENCLTERFDARSGDVGRQVLFSLTRSFNERLQLTGGYGRFLPGAYLKETARDGGLNTPFVTLSFRF